MIKYIFSSVHFNSIIKQNFLYIRVPKHHEIHDKLEEPQFKNTDEEDANDIGDYEEDLTDQRIEGIEALVEQLSKTVLELSTKVLKNK